jgi:hypothetical protein
MSPHHRRTAPPTFEELLEKAEKLERPGSFVPSRSAPRRPPRSKPAQDCAQGPGLGMALAIGSCATALLLGLIFTAIRPGSFPTFLLLFGSAATLATSIRYWWGPFTAACAAAWSITRSAVDFARVLRADAAAAKPSVPCGLCGGKMHVKTAKAKGSGCLQVIVILTGLVLAPVLIGIPIIIYALLYMDRPHTRWECDGCGTWIDRTPAQ